MNSNRKTIVIPKITFDNDEKVIESAKQAYASLFRAWYPSEYKPVATTSVTVDNGNLYMGMNISFTDFEGNSITSPFMSVPRQTMSQVLSNLANPTKDQLPALFAQAINNTLRDIAKIYKQHVILNKALEVDFNSMIAKVKE